MPAIVSVPVKDRRMKLLGFTGIVNTELPLQTESIANIAFTWDSSRTQHIGYSIPLKLLAETPGSLVQKYSSIGWKIKEGEIPEPTNTGTGRRIVVSEVVRVPAGTGPHSTPIGSGPQNNRSNMPREMKELSFWSKFMITL